MRALVALLLIAGGFLLLSWLFQLGIYYVGGPDLNLLIDKYL